MKLDKIIFLHEPPNILHEMPRILHELFKISNKIVLDIFVNIACILDLIFDNLQ